MQLIKCIHRQHKFIIFSLKTTFIQFFFITNEKKAKYWHLNKKMRATLKKFALIAMQSIKSQYRNIKFAFYPLSLN